METVEMARQLGMGVGALNVLITLGVLVYARRSKVQPDMGAMVPPLYLAFYRIVRALTIVCLFATLYATATNLAGYAYPVPPSPARPLWVILLILSNTVLGQLVYLLPALLLAYMTNAVLEVREGQGGGDDA